LLLAESLLLAHASGTLRTRDLGRGTVDTTVQPQKIAFRPTPSYCTRQSRDSTVHIWLRILLCLIMAALRGALATNPETAS
jgi:hypothetical protein